MAGGEGLSAPAAPPAPGGRARGALHGLLVGALAALLLLLLGVDGIAGIDNGFVLVPAGGALGAALGAFGGLRWLAAPTAVLLLLVLLLAFTPWTALTAGWTRDDPLPDHPVDAVVVLSSGLSSDSTLVDSGVDRLLTGLELVRRGVAPRLITTRVVEYDRGVRVTSDADQARLVHLAGLDSVWSVVDSVGVTRDEAVGTARLLGPGREVVLVTSPAHTRRACAAFEAVGVRVVCRPALERDRRSGVATTPTQRLSVFGALLYEWLGLLKYRVRGWV